MGMGKSMGSSKEISTGKVLSDQEEIFVGEMVEHQDIQRAALAAKYAKTTAASIAYEWIAPGCANFKPHVYEEYQRRRNKVLAKVAAKYEITAERTLQELAKIGYGDILPFVSGEGKTRDLDLTNLGPENAGMISEFTVETVGKGDKAVTRNKIKLWSKESALVTLAKHQGLLKPDAAQINLTLTLEQLIVGSLSVNPKPDGETKS